MSDDPEINASGGFGALSWATPYKIGWGIDSPHYGSRTKLRRCRNAWLGWGVLAFVVGSCGPARQQSSQQLDTVVRSGSSFFAGISGGARVAASSPVFKTSVAILNTQTHKVCSGVIISPDTVLTSRHCLLGAFSDSILIQFGTPIDYSGRLSKQWVAPLGELNNFNDIGLVFFLGGLPQGYTYANILENFDVLKLSTPIVLTGFGTQSMTDQDPVSLRGLNQRISRIAGDRKWFDINQTEGGLCGGDTGGGAFVYINGNYYLFGIIGADDYCERAASGKDFIKDAQTIFSIKAYYRNFLIPNVKRFSAYFRIGQYVLSR